MKVFVYDKRTNATLATYERVKKVETGDGKIYIFTPELEIYEWDTKKVKTRIYQN